MHNNPYRADEGEAQHSGARMVVKSKFEVSKDGTALFCWCDDGELSRIQQLICDEMRITAKLELVNTILLRHISQLPVATPLTIRGRIALTGCWLVAAVVVIIVLLGIERLFTLVAG